MSRRGRFLAPSSSSSIGSKKSRDRHKVTESSYDSESETENEVANVSSDTAPNSTPDTTASVKSILRTIVLRIHRRESEEMAKRVLKDAAPSYLKSLIHTRLAYRAKLECDNSEKEAKTRVQDNTIQLLQSRLDGVDLDSATIEQLQGALEGAMTEDMFSIEAANADATVDKLAAIKDITTEDIERHFSEMSHTTMSVYGMLIERYGKEIDECRFLSGQNDGFSKNLPISHCLKFCG